MVSINNFALKPFRINNKYIFLHVFFFIIAMASVMLLHDNCPFACTPIAEAQTFDTSGPTQLTGPAQQSPENDSWSSSLSFSEYNNSRYGFRIQYPSDWQVIPIPNSSLSPPITENNTEVIARIKSPLDPQERMEDLVTVRVENLSATSSEQGNRSLSAYDYAAPVIQQLSLMSKAPTEPNKAILVLNESHDVISEINGNDIKNLSAWRIDYVSSDYNSDVFIISDTNLFDIAFSTSKERATHSVPMFDKLLNTIQFTNTESNATSGDSFSNTDTSNATNNQSITNLRTIPSSQILQQGVRPPLDLQQDQIQNPQQPALLVPPFSTDPSDSQPQQSDQKLQQLQQQSIPQQPFGEIQLPYQQQPGPQLPSPLQQQTYPLLPPSAPLSQLPSIPPMGPEQAYNYLSPVIMSQYPYANNLSSFQIVGEVLNQAQVVAKSVRIMATLYNQYGQIIGTDFGYTEPSDLSPGQWAPFNITVQDDSAPTYQMTNYALNIDWRS